MTRTQQPPRRRAWGWRDEADGTSLTREAWYATRAARDAALIARRARGVTRGLSRTAVRAGIYPVRRDMRETEYAYLVRGDE